MSLRELANFYTKRAFRLLKHAGLKTVLQRFIILMGPLRNVILASHKRLSKNNPSITSGTTQFVNLDKKVIASNLQCEGFSNGIYLNKTTIEAVLKYAQETPVEKDTFSNIHVSTEMIEAPILGIRTYPFNNPHKRCHTIEQIATDDTVIQIVSEYLGVANPILFSSKLYWSFPNHQSNESNYAPQYYHFDVSDSKALTLFFYLTDVDETSGPHVVVKGTNKNRTLFNLMNWKMNDEKAEKVFGEKIHSIVGPSGTGFFEDLLNYHKHAFATQKTPRLMLAFTYVIQRKV
jgi:hypothetical protein